MVLKYVEGLLLEEEELEEVERADGEELTGDSSVGVTCLLAGLIVAGGLGGLAAWIWLWSGGRG